MEEAISMASKYLDMCPPVLASLKAGTPIIAIETGFFMQLPYPHNLEALQECEQAFYRRDCVPCCVGIVNGRLKAGLSKQDMDTLCRSGGSCTRSQIPALVGGGSTSGTGPSATLAIARMAGIIPVMAPGLRDSLADLDALSGSSRLVFCGKVSPDKALLFSSRGVPVLRLPAEELADAYLVQRDLEVNECTVIPCGDTLGDIAEKASAVAMDIKRKVSAV